VTDPDRSRNEEMTDTPPSQDPAADGPQSYEAAAERLEQIIERLDSGAAGLRETLDLVKEGRALVEYCASELEAVGKGLEELRLDELVARLEAGGPPPGSQPVG
jgi:exodeoxyribonuclease VII small subunit